MPNNETIERIQQIRERLTKATPGPWHFDGDCCDDSKEDPYIYVNLKPKKLKAVSVLFTADWGTTEDAELIAHAPSDIEYLLAALSEMRTIALREAAEIARKVANLEAAESDSQKEQEHYQRSNRRKSRAAVAFNIANEIEELGRIDK